MQTFINPTTPFFDSLGNIIPGGRISFVSLDTDGEYVDVYDEDGNRLANPLTLASDGTFNSNEVPYFEDGLSFKVIVEAPTGVEAIESQGEIINADQLYTTVRTFVVKAIDDNTVIQNITVVYGIASVRLADKSVGSVVCVGYSDKEDGCPAREFTWIDSVNPATDNAFNILRNPGDNTGYWLMSEPEGVVDVRMGGVFTEADASTTSANLANLANKVTTLSRTGTLYFPAGRYNLASGQTIVSGIMERGVYFYPSGATISMTFVHLENRGGKFCALDNTSEAYRVLPVIVNGELRTSWLQGTLNEFLTDSVVSACESIVFDSIAYTGGASVTITNKRVVLKTSVANTISFVKCFIDNFVDGRIDVQSGTSISSVSPSGVSSTMDGNYSKMEGGDITATGTVSAKNGAFSEDISCRNMTANYGISADIVKATNGGTTYSALESTGLRILKDGVTLATIANAVAIINSAKTTVSGLLVESNILDYPTASALAVDLNTLYPNAEAGTIVKVRNIMTPVSSLKGLVKMYVPYSGTSSAIVAKKFGWTVVPGVIGEFVCLGSATFTDADTSEEVTAPLWALCGNNGYNIYTETT